MKSPLLVVLRPFLISHVPTAGILAQHQGKIASRELVDLASLIDLVGQINFDVLLSVSQDKRS